MTSSSPRAAASPRTPCSPRPALESSSTPRSGVFVPTSVPPGVEAVGTVTGEGLQRIDVPPKHKGRGKCFVCICEDVTTKDVTRAIAEGFDSIELAKRYTTVTMGPCQGKLCQLASIRLYAEEVRAYETRARGDDRSSAVVARRDGAPRRSPFRARASHGPALPARGSGGEDAVGGAVEAPVRVLRAARGRGSRRARVPGRDRCVDAREDPGRRPGGSCAPRASLPEPLRGSPARPDPLRRADLGRRAGSWTTAPSGGSRRSSTT